MRYLRVYAGADGGSRLEDVELKGTMTQVAEGVPPLLVSGPFACREIAFVEEQNGVGDWNAHVAPRKQWIIVIAGRAAITATDGDRREVGPGDVILAEDTTGKGHLTTPLTATGQFAMIPVA